MKLSLLILDLKDSKLQDSRKKEDDKRYHGLPVLGINEDLRAICVNEVIKRGKGASGASGVRRGSNFWYSPHDLGDWA